MVNPAVWRQGSNRALSQDDDQADVDVWGGYESYGYGYSFLKAADAGVSSGMIWGAYSWA